MLNYLNILAANPAVFDLRVIQAVLLGGTLSVSLQWTSPSGAANTMVRYAATPVTAAGWDWATVLSADLPEGQNSLTARLPYNGGSVYFALRTQDAGGD